MLRIIGVDPGSRVTGFGIIELRGDTPVCIGCGCITVPAGPLPGRMKVIFEGLSEVVNTHKPTDMAVEQVFMHRNAGSALKLGHARGAALLAGVLQALPVHEYTPTQIKQAVTGRGHAGKEQVQHMIRVLLGLRETPRSDAADALAVALCHGHTNATQQKMAAAGVPMLGSAG